MNSIVCLDFDNKNQQPVETMSSTKNKKSYFTKKPITRKFLGNSLMIDEKKLLDRLKVRIYDFSGMCPSRIWVSDIWVLGFSLSTIWVSIY